MMSSANATLHTGMTMVVRKARGMPTTVMPRMLSAAMMPRQTLWQTCHEPRMLAMPEMLPSPLRVFSVFISVVVFCLMVAAPAV